MSVLRSCRLVHTMLSLVNPAPFVPFEASLHVHKLCATHLGRFSPLQATTTGEAHLFHSPRCSLFVFYRECSRPRRNAACLGPPPFLCNGEKQGRFSAEFHSLLQ